MDIEQRNRLRAEAHLPQLDADAENEKLSKVREDAAFEREWSRRQHEFRHLWEDNRDGWITAMGKYTLCRRQVRREMKKIRD
jgi:hypothetical protein